MLIGVRLFAVAPRTTQAKMAAYLEGGGRRGRHGVHVYELEWFGLSEADVENSEAMAEYARYFGLSTSFKLGAEY